ncbi:MAG: class I SAM-dependent DNA methyltransferase [Methanobacterium sp.]
MKQPEFAIVFNGSPLFTGDAGSGESEIRRWVIENDWLESIIALPTQLFYNTGINTFIWILTNCKEEARKSRIMLIDASNMYVKMKKSLGDKRREISEEQIKEITDLYLENSENCRVKNFNSSKFGYRKITIDRPLRMNFATTTDRISRLCEERAFINLATSKKRNEKEKIAEIKKGQKLQKKIKQVLIEMPDSISNDYNDFDKLLKRAFKNSGIKMNASLKKTIINALGERDSNSKVIINNNGKIEADPYLRDYENVPLTENVLEYFESEVKPYAPDAWINEDKRYFDVKDLEIGKVGYEINFNKYFYEYKPPRPLEKIDHDLKEVQKEILNLLEDLTE